MTVWDGKKLKCVFHVPTHASAFIWTCWVKKYGFPKHWYAWEVAMSSFRSIFSVDDLRESSEPLEKLLSNHFYSDKYWGASYLSCFIFQGTFKHGIPYEVKRKVMFSVETAKQHRTNCRQHRSEDYKGGPTHLNIRLPYPSVEVSVKKCTGNALAGLWLYM